MDGDAGFVSENSQKEKKRLHRDFLVNVEELEEVEKHGTKRPHKEQQDAVKRMKHFVAGNHGSDPEHCDAESSAVLLFYPVCASQDRWAGREDEVREQDIRHNLLHSCCTAEGSIDQVIQESQISMFEYSMYPNEQRSVAGCPLISTVTLPVTPVTHRPRLFIPVPGSVTTAASTISSVVHPAGSSPVADMCGPISSMCSPTGSAWDTLRSISSSPGFCDGDPVCAAAHLHLLGESLSLIGLHLQETSKMVCMSSGLSLLLDSLLCALAPLICLTNQVPELKSCTQHTLVSTLENISYLMPGL